MGNNMNRMNNNFPMNFNNFNNINNNNNINSWISSYNNPNKETDDSNKISIIFEYKKTKYNELCNYNDKFQKIAKRWCKKYGIKYKNHKFIFNAKNTPNNLTIAQAGIMNMSIIIVYESPNKVQNDEKSDDEDEDEDEDEYEDTYFQPGRPKKNIIFKNVNGTVHHIVIDEEASISRLLKIYFNRIGRPELISSMESNIICFLYNALKLKIDDKTKVKDFFKMDPNPKVVVNDINNMIGA